MSNNQENIYIKEIRNAQSFEELYKVISKQDEIPAKSKTYKPEEIIYLIEQVRRNKDIRYIPRIFGLREKVNDLLMREDFSLNHNFEKEVKNAQNYKELYEAIKKKGKIEISDDEISEEVNKVKVYSSQDLISLIEQTRRDEKVGLIPRVYGIRKKVIEFFDKKYKDLDRIFELNVKNAHSFEELYDLIRKKGYFIEETKHYGGKSSRKHYPEDLIYLIEQARKTHQLNFIPPNFGIQGKVHELLFIESNKKKSGFSKIFKVFKK